MTTTLCTLYERDFHHGVAALANSLIRVGYKGTLVVGHKGERPHWAPAAFPTLSDHIVSADFRLRFVPLAPDRHLAYFKPLFIRDVFTTHCPESDQVIYLDPDIVVKCRASLLDHWCHDGIALVEDVNPNMPARHPLRLEWMDFLGKQGIVPSRNLERYYNSGFVGLGRKDLNFCNDWDRMMQLVIAHVGAHTGIKAGTADALFYSTDQDALNMALMCSQVAINAAGPDAMDFLPGGILLSHAVGQPKPWATHFIKQALCGIPPSTAAKAYWQDCSGPLASWPAAHVNSQQRRIKLASFISRFYRRN